MELLIGSYTSPYGLSSSEPVFGAITALANTPRFREQVLLALLRTRRLNDETTELLRDFVRNGTKNEAVAATRRLDGFRVVHDTQLTDRQRREAEPAHGRVWYWIRA